jgi:hypothetical protein
MVRVVHRRCTANSSVVTNGSAPFVGRITSGPGSSRCLFLMVRSSDAGKRTPARPLQKKETNLARDSFQFLPAVSSAVSALVTDPKNLGNLFFQLFSMHHVGLGPTGLLSIFASIFKP